MPGDLLIRADATARMGTGHVMRAMALAQAWQAHGGRARLLSCCESPALCRRVEAGGVACDPLSCRHPDPDDWRVTASALRTLDRPGEAAWLAFDGYHLDGDYQRTVRTTGRRLMVIDDLNHLPRYHADVLLNQNVNATDHVYRCDPDTRLLLGTRYALLRPEFTALGADEPAVPTTARRVLVTLGGADADNVTATVLAALALLDRSDLLIRVVAGPANPHLPALRAAAQAGRGTIEVWTAVEDMPALMRWADLAVTAGGTTCWELLCLGVPSLVAVVADNQERIVERLHETGAVIGLGWPARCPVERLAAMLDEAIGSAAIRRRLRSAGRALVDGQGARRVVEILSAVAAPAGARSSAPPA